MIVYDNIQKLWKYDLQDLPLGAVSDYGIMASERLCRQKKEVIGLPKGKAYFNSGVLLINLKKWRQENYTKRILEIINEIKPDGIEANYLYVDRNENIINEVAKWNKFAKENNLFVTVGSDFHKKDGIHPEIGFVNTKFMLNDNVIYDIITNITR